MIFANFKNIQNHQAFTLAEVLITLGIIGVVAAMTTPTLMNKTNDAELKTALKKEYSSLSQAYSQALNESGNDTSGIFTSSKTLKDALAPYLSYVKICDGTAAHGGSGNGATAEGCWPSDWKKIDGTTISWSFTGPGFILKDGSFLAISSDASNCTTQDSTGNYLRCGTSLIDVNGFKKPNRAGKDIFEINFLPNKTAPKGSMPQTPATTCPDSNEALSNGGFDCTAKRIYGN